MVALYRGAQLLKHGDEMLYSASDLVGYLECAHSTALDLLNLETPLPVAVDDEQARLIQQKGFAHEAAYLASVRNSGQVVVDLSTHRPLEVATAETLSAMKAGADVVFQATLRSDPYFGHADFLRKVTTPSRFGAYSYEVVDTKLARSAKSKFLVQLAFYSDLLTAAQGSAPHAMHVILGDGRQESYRVADYGKYTALLRERFLSFVATPGERTTYPQPCAHCDICRWRDLCQERWLEDDHLSQVAGITRVQIGRLEDAGVTTMAELARLPADDAIPKMVPATLAKLRHQASLQVAYREKGERIFEVLPSAVEPTRGFTRLPKPSAHDLYFDIEGDPLEDGGLEYLLGIHYRSAGEPAFKSFWAHNRPEERNSFEKFMDFVSEWLAAHPDAHIYHYAAYEETALKRLMTLHGTREAEVDRLLREGRLIDLYKVVREAIRVSEPAYSIKNIERFYMAAREGEVQSAGASIVFYERWKETGNANLLQQIETYNRDDLISTQLLHGWLLSLRPDGLPWKDESQAEPPETPTSTQNPIEERLGKYRQTLVEALPADPASWTAQEHLRELVFQLLDFHRREAKPAWWAVFARMDKQEDELIEDVECIGALTRQTGSAPKADKRSFVHEYVFPDQEYKLKLGSNVRRCENAAPAGVIWALDEDNCKLTLRIGAKTLPLPDRLSVGPSGPINCDAMREALFRVADAFIARDDKYAAAFELLARNRPRFVGRDVGAPVIEGRRPITDEVAEAVGALDRSYLVIQGPPGAGKTYTGSRVIVDLLKRGKRVGVAANSHKAIHNLLDAVEKHASEVGVAFRGIKKASGSNEDSVYDGTYIQSETDNADVCESGADLIAGTAWLFSDPRLDAQLDYLFIDEAGQVALANVIAMATSARNVVLLGDQMQLGQPSQAVHPGRSGLSALDFLLEEFATIPDDRGVFLPDTYRMHPAVCQFISDAVYDSRLRPAQGNELQRLVLDRSAHPDLRPTGLRFIPVKHDGCSQRSEAEAEVVAQIYDSLLKQNWVDKHGRAARLTRQDILVVAPYNIQVNLLKKTLGDSARVGTVDKFQGQEAPVVIVSMATSNGDYLPRNIEFLYSKNRLNVAISRARCLSLLVACPDLLSVNCHTPEQMALVNLLCWAHEYSMFVDSKA